MELIIAAVIPVIGWITNHVLTLRAQRRAFVDNIRNDARVFIAKELKEYYVNLHSLFEEDAMIREKALTREWRVKPELAFDASRKVRQIIASFEFRPNFILVLEEYETLFPETRDAREELGKKHAELKVHLDKVLENVNNDVLRLHVLGELKKIDSSAVAAQKWLVQDLLVIIQNVTLGKITGNKVTQWGIQGKYPVRHPRFVLNKNGNIVLKHFDETS